MTVMPSAETQTPAQNTSTLPNQPAEQTKVEPNQQQVPKKPTKELVAWSASSRAFSRKPREWYVTLFAMAGIIALVLFFIDGLMPVILIISVIFLVYVLNTTEPGEVDYKLTNIGVDFAGSQTEWGMLRRFWFDKKNSSEVLIIETYFVPGKLEMVIDPAKKEEIRKVLLEHIPNEKAPTSVVDKATGWFSKRMPQA